MFRSFCLSLCSLKTVFALMRAIKRCKISNKTNIFSMNFFLLPTMNNKNMTIVVVNESNVRDDLQGVCLSMAKALNIIPLKMIHSNELKLDEMLLSDQNQKRTIKFVKNEVKERKSDRESERKREVDFYATKLHVIKF